ncbi:MAG: ABC transporter substrate-binding protein [Chloroflexota bacterium]
MSRYFMRVFLAALALASVTAAACGGEENDEPAATPEPVVETRVVTQEVTRVVEQPVEVTEVVEKEVEETVVVTATPVAVPPTPEFAERGEDRTPDPQNEMGNVVVAVDGVRPKLGLARASGGEGAAVHWGVLESLFTTAMGEGGPVFGEPWLVEDWDLADDLSKVDMTLAENVQFHDGWGEMTAEDVAFTINDANAAVTPESIHGQAGDLANIWGEWQATGRYTLEAPMDNFDPRWRAVALSDGMQPTGIFSKQLYDELGADGARDTLVGTGPFSVQEWAEGRRAVLEAVQDHWRKTPEIDTLTLIEAGEPAVRAAMLRVGDADIAQVALKDIPDLVDEGFETTGTAGGAELNIAFSGNLWETEDPLTDEPLEREGLDPSQPWIGDPSDPEGFERARKVRQALAMAIDREAISDALTGGVGWPHYIPMFNPVVPEFKEEWEVPYDPDAARQLLEEAGYEDGFEAVIFGQCCDNLRQSTAEAVAGYWRQDLGLDVEVQSYGYRPNWRPQLVNRSTTVPHVHACDDGRLPRPWDWPVGITFSSLSRGGFGCAVESDFITEKWLEVAREPDFDRRLEINMEVGDHLRETMIGTGVFTSPALILYNPKSIEEWEPRPGLSGPIGATEKIVPVQR